MEESMRIRFVFQVTHSAHVRKMKAMGWHRAKKTARGSCCHQAFLLKDGQEWPGSGTFRRKFWENLEVREKLGSATQMSCSG